MIISLVQFDSSVSLGNLLTILLLLGGGARAYYSIGQTTTKSTEKIDELARRLNAADLERLKVCVETMWLFQLRRGVAEVEERGLGTSHSPVQLTDAANELMRPFLPELRAFYRTIQGDDIGLVELAIALEKEFGMRITAEVCKKIGITESACLVLAIGQLRPIGPDELWRELDQFSDAKDLKKESESYLRSK